MDAGKERGGHGGLDVLGYVGCHDLLAVSGEGHAADVDLAR